MCCNRNGLSFLNLNQTFDMAPPPYLPTAVALTGDAGILSGIKVKPLIYSPICLLRFGLVFLRGFLFAFDEPGFICMPAEHTHTPLQDLRFAFRGIWTFSLLGRKISSCPVSHLIASNGGAIKRPILERLPRAKPG